MIYYPLLKPAFSFYGEPRTDGELNGVFYRKSRCELIQGKVWHIPSIGPIGNTVTMLQIKDIPSGQFFAVFNIHLAFGADEREQEV